MKQQFEQNIKHAIDKDWDCFGWRKKKDEFDISIEMQSERMVRFWFSHKKLLSRTHWHDYSLADIYASHSFWRSLCGKEMVCDQCGEYPDEDYGFCNEHIKGGYTPIPAYLYHIAECMQLPTPEEQTDYVHKLIKGEKTSG